MADRLKVLKTYKIYIGGKFPRTESGRYYTPKVNGKSIGNICLSSRKDFRNAVVAARSAQPSWGARSAFNRSQIIYRIAEMLEGRHDQFVQELMLMGSTKGNAVKEVNASIDRLVYYAGWCDKYGQVFSSINPVASSHFNFSVHEPQGIIGIIAPTRAPLLGLITAIIPAIVGGNTCVTLASEDTPIAAISFAEVLATSDVPGGVVNLLTGKVSELIGHFTTHMDVNGICYCLPNLDEEADANCADNMKRLTIRTPDDWLDDSCENPYYILDHQEVKTTWHPIEQIGGAAAGY